jgi:hypothetical protein
MFAIPPPPPLKVSWWWEKKRKHKTQNTPKNKLKNHMNVGWFGINLLNIRTCQIAPHVATLF